MEAIHTNNATIDPFCKQAWGEYCRRFCIYSVAGLAVGATCAFVFLGKPYFCNVASSIGRPTYRSFSIALGLGCGVGSAWTRTNVIIQDRKKARKLRNGDS